MESVEVRMIILWLLGVVGTTVWRIVRLAVRLYRRPLGLISPDGVSSTPADPEYIAKCAIAGGIRLERPNLNSTPSEDSSSPQVELQRIGRAQIRFRYFWDAYHLEVASLRRSSVLIMLISFSIVTFGIAPAFRGFCNDSHLNMSDCLSRTMFAQSVRLAPGILAAAIVYMASSFIESTLANRQNRWNYFCALIQDKRL